MLIFSSFAGISLLVWGLVCLAVGVTYVFLSPRLIRQSQTAPASWSYFILRWFHSLVWLLLALACFFWGSYLPGGSLLGNSLALLSLAVYLVFIITLILDRKPRSKPPRHI